MNKYITSLDWFSYSGYSTNIHCLNELYRISLEPLPYGTKVFRETYVIIDTELGEEIAEIQARPRSSALNANLVIVKLINRILYEYDIYPIIERINNALQIAYNDITRLDICCDFNTFENKWDGQRLIEYFVKSRIRKGGRTSYKLMGDQHGGQHEYSYLCFGSNSSDVIAYIYDKSKELEEVKEKPYIREKWRKCGLDDKRVWRVEFRIQSSYLRLYNKKNEEEYRISLANLKYDNYRYSIFSALVQKYFRFAVNTPSVRDFDRLRPIKLFPMLKNNFDVVMSDPYTRQSNRFTKTYISKTIDLLEVANEDLRPTINEFIEVLRIQYPVLFPMVESRKKLKPYRPQNETGHELY